MARIHVTVKDQAVRQGFAALKTKITNLKPAFSDVGEALKIEIDKRFATETDWNGQRWPSNAISTIRDYIEQRKGYGRNGRLNAKGVKLAGSKKILEGLSKELRRSIYWSAFSDSLAVGSPKPYAAIHNMGGKFRAWGKTELTMPTRQFIPIDRNGTLHPKAVQIIKERLTYHLQR